MLAETRYLGSNIAMYDDQQTYFESVIGLINDVERGAG
jgi:hypothetical protein